MALKPTPDTRPFVAKANIANNDGSGGNNFKSERVGGRGGERGRRRVSVAGAAPGADLGSSSKQSV